MAKSTQVITDLKSATTTAFGATATAAAAAATAGQMSPTDLNGMANIALTKAEELLILLNSLVLDSNGATTNALVKAGDPNFTVLDSVRQVLV